MIVPATVIYCGQTSSVPGAVAEGDHLWLPLDELRKATGWEWKPEGVCRGDECVPIPPGREQEFLRRDGSGFNLSAFARLRGQPVVHDDAHAVWVFGDSASNRRNALFSLQAPDFTLPDLDGHRHSLSQHRGKKVFLYCWASW